MKLNTWGKKYMYTTRQRSIGRGTNSAWRKKVAAGLRAARAYGKAHGKRVRFWN